MIKDSKIKKNVELHNLVIDDRGLGKREAEKLEAFWCQKTTDWPTLEYVN